MSEMVERLISALDSAMGLTREAARVGGFYKPLLTEAAKEKLSAGALAVLTEMREPTPAMFQAGTREVHVENCSDAREIWQAMIDASLQEPPRAP